MASGSQQSSRTLSSIVLLDTSVYLNVLDIDGFNQHRQIVLKDFLTRVESGDHFLLPMATIWETGNHIAGLSDGGQRRRYAQTLFDDVTKAVQGDVPYRPTYFPEREEFLKWLSWFPDYVQRGKTEKKRGGISLADLSLIKEWERTCDRHKMSHVLIWSLDADISSYDRHPD
jgi:hypothetical protein